MTGICGVAVPVAFWPWWVQAIARILPVTHGLHSIRLAWTGGRLGDVVFGTGIEVLIGLGWLGLGILTLDRTVNIARRRGTIELI